MATFKMMALRRSPSTTRRLFSTNWVEQYGLLPEVIEAGKVSGEKKIPLLQRAADICANSMPIDHPLSVHALFNLATAHERVGEYGEAKEILNKLLDGNTGSDDVAPSLARALSVVHLKMGDVVAAEELGWKSFNAIEAADPITTDVAALGEALQCVGLAKLAKGDFEASIGYLQQSSRMCKEGVPSLTALFNLAGAHWWKATSNHFTKYGLAIVEDDGGESVSSEPADESTNADSTLVQMNELDEALSYFIEVIDIANGEEGTNMEGLSDWTSCTTPISKNNTAKESEQEDDNYSKTRDYLNKVELLKANAMAGIGNSKIFYGDVSVESINESSEAMLSAMTASSNLISNLSTKPSENNETSSSSNNDNSGAGSDRHFYPMMCANLVQVRALTVLGKQKHNTGLPVSAEGLYRSALSTIESLESSNKTKQNALGLFEKWQLLLCYETLLIDWENRDSDAIKMKQRANDTLSQLLSHRGKTKGAPVFSSFLVIPTLDDIGEELRLFLK